MTTLNTFAHLDEELGMPDLIEKQRAWQAENVAAQQKQWLEREAKKSFAVSAVGKKVLSKLVPKGVELAEERLVERRKAPNPRYWVKAILKIEQECEVEWACYVEHAIVTALEGAIEEMDRRTVMNKIMELVDHQIMQAKLRNKLNEIGPNEYEWYRKRMETASSRYLRARKIDEELRAHFGTANRFFDDVKESEGLAMFLYGIALEVTGYIEFDEREYRAKDGGFKHKVTLLLNEEGQKHLAEIESMLLAPLYKDRPLHMRPRYWTTAFDGGRPDRMTPLMSGWVRSRNTRLNEDRPREVIDAVNNLQAAEYCINYDLLCFAQERFDADDPDLFETTRNCEPAPLPELPAELLQLRDLARTTRGKTAIELGATPEQDYEIAVHNQKYWALKAEATSLVAKERTTRKVLAEAWANAEEERIWFECHIDWRGRVYYDSADLGPQGAALEKALLSWANPISMDEDDAEELKVCIAELYGISGASFTREEQIDWFDANEERVRYCGAAPSSPLGQMWRDESVGFKDRFMFVARCMDWAGWVEQGPDYPMRGIIYQDAVCSGHQNLAADTRDEEVAPYVSLTDNPLRGDIYSRVLEFFKGNLDDMAANAKASIAETGALLKHIWGPVLEKHGRKFTKQPTMTAVYSQGSGGRREDLLKDWLPITDEELMARIGPQFKTRKDPQTGEKVRVRGRPGDAVWVIAAKTEGPLGRAVAQATNRASKAMKGLQLISGVMSEHKLHMEWTSPSGLRVQQRYYPHKIKENIILWELDTHRQMTVRETLWHDVDENDSFTSVSPNRTHSFDAAHMHKIVNAYCATGQTDIVGIHDSVGVPINQIRNVGRIIRETFVEIYHDKQWLWTFFDEQVEIARDANKPEAVEALMEIRPKLVKLFEQGTLDIRDVLKSRHMFSY